MFMENSVFIIHIITDRMIRIYLPYKTPYVIKYEHIQLPHSCELPLTIVCTSME